MSIDYCFYYKSLEKRVIFSKLVMDKLIGVLYQIMEIVT